MATTKPPVGKEEIQACAAAVDKMNSDCNMVTNSNTAGVMQMGSMLLKAIAANPQNACDGMAQFAVAAQAGILAYNLSCQNSVSSCIDDCTPKSIEASDPAMTSGRIKCDRVAAKAQPDWSVLAQMMGVGQEQTMACQQTVAATTNPACIANPLAPGCAGYSASDCSNPANSGSPMCRCLMDASACSQVNSQGTPTNALTGGGALNGSAGLAGSGGGLGDAAMGLMGTPVGGSGGSQKQGLAGGAPGGGAGHGGMSGFGAGDGSGKKPNAAAKLADNAKGSIYGGLLNSGGAPGGAAHGGGYGSPGAGNGKAVLGAKYADKLNFDRFKPNMPYDPSRALAGSRVAPRDGITGADTNIWEKVKTQFYQQGQQGSFISK